ncbi:MAG: protein kinase, partial [Acidobacteriota bacterium]
MTHAEKPLRSRASQPLEPDAATTIYEGPTVSAGEPGSPPGSSAETPPATQLGRFKLGALLGQGGMGRVYEALDPRLKRQVAVKIMQRHDPQGVARFLREARAQAAVAHRGICPIFEAGEVDGRPYIVMQRLHGRPLHEAAASLSLEHKLRTLANVADAVEAAHRTGLIHRDIKPSNIIVESTFEDTAEGRHTPYVLDFGLARPAHEGVLTAEGALLGTPAYMAPEQAQGDQGALGPRTDVYGLGATLYHVLAGRSPFPDSYSSALRHILEREPPPLRVFGVPAEVEAITFKCLEKEPARRYASAGALADDLRRYLAGQPVQARPAGWWYRLRKRVRRNAALVTVSGISIALLLAALAWGLFSSWQGRTRERLARTFTQQVEQVEALARYSHLSPLHDVRPDRAQLRQRMDAIQQEMERGGSLARAAGSYALGRGHLALEELDAAHRHLEAAWAAGERRPEVAAALAQTLSGLYREGLAAAELVRDWESRERRVQELEQTYGQPALSLLRQTPSDPSVEQPFLAALVPFHEDRFQDALEVLGSSRGRYPWSYELHKLEGDIRRTLATRHSATGEREAALAELQRAQRAYAAAATIAESDPAIHRAAAQASILGVSLEIFAVGDLESALAAGLEHVERALAVNPRDAQSWLWKARLHRIAAQRQRLHSIDPEAELVAAAAAARQSVDLLAEPSEAWRELGSVYWGWAQWQKRRGDDSQPKIAEATDALERVASAQRDYPYFNTLALAHATSGDLLTARGQDATASYDRAITAYRSAIALHSSPFAALVNMGAGLLKRSATPEVVDPSPWLREAVTAFDQATELDPDHFAPHYYLGRTYLILAQGGRATSGRLGETVVQSIASYQRALEINPGLSQIHSVLGEAAHLQALDAWDHGVDPEPFFRRARQAYERGLEIARDNELLHQNLAWTAYFEGKYRVREGRDPGPLLEEAIDRARTALKLSTRAGALLCLGSAYRLQAEYEVLRRGDPSEALTAAEQAFRRILEQNPQHPEAFRSLGRLHTLEARWLMAPWRAQRGADPGAAFDRGRAALDRALELETEVAAFGLADARWWRARAGHHPAGSADRSQAASAGLASTERALE